MYVTIAVAFFFYKTLFSHWVVTGPQWSSAGEKNWWRWMWMELRGSGVMLPWKILKVRALKKIPFPAFWVSLLCRHLTNNIKNTEAAFGGLGTSSARPISHPRADLRQSPTVGKGTWKNVQQIPGGMRRLGVGRPCCYVNCFLNPVCVPVLVLINSFPNTELARLSSVDNKIVLRTLDFNWTPMNSKDLVRVWCCWLFISGENVTNLLKSLLFYKPGARF